MNNTTCYKEKVHFNKHHIIRFLQIKFTVEFAIVKVSLITFIVSSATKMRFVKIE